MITRLSQSNVMSRHRKKLKLVGGGFGGQQEIIDALKASPVLFFLISMLLLTLSKNYLECASAQAQTMSG